MTTVCIISVTRPLGWLAVAHCVSMLCTANQNVLGCLLRKTSSPIALKSTKKEVFLQIFFSCHLINTSFRFQPKECRVRFQ